MLCNLFRSWQDNFVVLLVAGKKQVIVFKVWQYDFPARSQNLCIFRKKRKGLAPLHNRDWDEFDYLKKKVENLMTFSLLWKLVEIQWCPVLYTAGGLNFRLYELKH